MSAKTPTDDDLRAVRRATHKVALLRRANALVDRAKKTTGYYQFSAHNPPPSMQEMVEVMAQLLELLEGTR